MKTPKNLIFFFQSTETLENSGIEDINFSEE